MSGLNLNDSPNVDRKISKDANHSDVNHSGETANDAATGNIEGLGRRRMLGLLASGAAIAGLGATAPMTAIAAAKAASPLTAPDVAGIPDDLFSQSRLRNYKSRRASSWDRSGGDADMVQIEAGKSATLLDITGAGVITHIWVTIVSPDEYHLKNLVLRAWWDGESSPSIEVPVGDFFGLGLGEYFIYESELTAVSTTKAMNAYFQMPFSSAARITVTNEGSKKTDAYFFAIDYVVLPGLPADLGRFHAQYAQAAPCKGEVDDWNQKGDNAVYSRKNLDGKGNYVYMEATGRGHFVGVTQSVLQNQNSWFGEGDDMFFIDGDTLPTINGTGTEDYFNGAWNFGKQAFSHRNHGAPFIENPERIGGRYCMYRWHTESPIAFEKSIRATIEHGHANNRSDDYYSVAYWYQTEPHAGFPALPAAETRIPRIFRVAGDGAAPVPGE
ncbi:DUF2961 domain-containing protein [Acidicapsa ligni]|uniref:DUF2961 domain-containing protein n=1 Tax=Acidicapsa ligni TaxID=542300 RepID=UPI0021E034DD|nr:DUF2961 domain-containing protein [Acidicapsa ligni]